MKQKAPEATPEKEGAAGAAEREESSQAIPERVAITAKAVETLRRQRATERGDDPDAPPAEMDIEMQADAVPAADANVTADTDADADADVDATADASVDVDADATTEANAAAEELVTVKIDGVTTQVPISEIRDAGIRTYQKQAAADKRLEEATRMQRQAADFLQQVSQQQLLPTPPDASDAEELNAATKKVSAAIYSGDEEEVSTAFAELVRSIQGSTRSDGQTADPVAIAAQVRQMISQEQYAQDLADAQAAFETEFPELNSDPDLRELTNLKTIAIQNANPAWTPRQIITQAAEEVNKKIRRETATKNSAASADRVAAKRSATVPNTAGTRAPAPPEQKPLSRSEVVAAARARRPVS